MLEYFWLQNKRIQKFNKKILNLPSSPLLTLNILDSKTRTCHPWILELKPWSLNKFKGKTNLLLAHFQICVVPNTSSKRFVNEANQSLDSFP